MESFKARQAFSIAVYGAGNCEVQVIFTALPGTEEEGPQDGNSPSYPRKGWQGDLQGTGLLTMKTGIAPNKYFYTGPQPPCLISHLPPLPWEVTALQNPY